MLDLTPFAAAPGSLPGEHWAAWLAAVLTSDGVVPAAPGPAVAAEDWAQLTPRLEAHGLAPLVYLRMHGSPLWSAVPQDSQVALARSFRVSAARAWAMEAELAALCDAFQAAEVPVALLKGAALGRSIYESPAQRPVSDLDLLVPPDRMECALRATAAQGYRSVGPVGSGAVARWQRRYRSELPLVGGRNDLLVELHWSLVELPYYLDRIPIADIWSNARPVRGLPGVAAPCPEILLLHSCLHIAFHHSRDIRLIWLVDLDRLARRKALDWDIVVRLTEKWGVGPATSAALEAVIRWLDTPIPGAVRAALGELAANPVGRSMLGLGDESSGRAWRRARVTWSAFTWRQRLRYAAWLGLRALSWPLEALLRRARQ